MANSMRPRVNDHHTVLVAVRVVRWGLPLGLAIAGLVLLTVAGESDSTLGLGIVLVGTGAIVAIWNVLLRLSFSSQEDRGRGPRARRPFSQPGHGPQGSR